MIGVPSGVWDETKSWSLSQRVERARTRPYLLERMLAQTPLLGDIVQCASMHHERLDGSGYPRGLRRESIPMPGRILAVADVYQALRQPRPYRDALDQDEAALVLREEARAGRLDNEAVHAVLHGDRGRVRRRVELPGGLTKREAAVIVAVGVRTLEPSDRSGTLDLAQTVSAHLEHIYTKLGVSTRTEAALFAMQHGLMETATSP